MSKTPKIDQQKKQIDDSYRLEPAEFLMEEHIQNIDFKKEPEEVVKLLIGLQKHLRGEMDLTRTEKNWFIDVFDNLVAKDPKTVVKSLHIIKPGRQEKLKPKEQQELALDVHKLVLCGAGRHKMENTKKDVNGAYKIVAERWDLSANKVAEIYSEYSELCEAMTEFMLHRFEVENRL